MPVKCPPILGQQELEFSGVMAQLGGGADEPFISEIGTCCRPHHEASPPSFGGHRQRVAWNEPYTPHGSLHSVCAKRLAIKRVDHAQSLLTTEGAAKFALTNFGEAQSSSSLEGRRQTFLTRLKQIRRML